MWIAEVNLKPTGEWDRYNVDTVETVCDRNRRMLEAGKQPTHVPIGTAGSTGEARRICDAHKASQP